MFIILTDEDGEELALNSDNLTRIYTDEDKLIIWDSEEKPVIVTGITLKEFISLVNNAKA